MCGEIDEQVLVGQELADRLRAVAQGAAPAGDLPDLADDAGRAAYMEAVFQGGLADAAAAVTGCRTKRWRSMRWRSGRLRWPGSRDGSPASCRPRPTCSAR